MCDENKCHGCPNNTPTACPYENDGHGHCPMNREIEEENEDSCRPVGAVVGGTKTKHVLN